MLVDGAREEEREGEEPTNSLFQSRVVAFAFAAAPLLSSPLSSLLSHGSHQADRPQVDGRKGAAQAARDEGRTQVGTDRGRSQEGQPGPWQRTSTHRRSNATPASIFECSQRVLFCSLCVCPASPLPTRNRRTARDPSLPSVFCSLPSLAGLDDLLRDRLCSSLVFCCVCSLASPEKSTDLLLRKLPFQRLVREIAQGQFLNFGPQRTEVLGLSRWVLTTSFDCLIVAVWF